MIEYLHGMQEAAVQILLAPFIFLVIAKDFKDDLVRHYFCSTFSLFKQFCNLKCTYKVSVADMNRLNKKVISYLDNKTIIPKKKTNLNEFEKSFLIVVHNVKWIALENISFETRSSTNL